MTNAIRVRCVVCLYTGTLPSFTSVRTYLFTYLSLYLLSIDILHICIWPKIYYENIYSILALFCNHFYSYSLLIKLAFLSMEPPLTERHKDCMEWCSARPVPQCHVPAVPIGADNITPVSSVRDLGIYLDADMSMKAKFLELSAAVSVSCDICGMFNGRCLVIGHLQSCFDEARFQQSLLAGLPVHWTYWTGSRQASAPVAASSAGELF